MLKFFPLSGLNNFNNLNDFIRHLRTFKKSSLIQVGLQLLWSQLEQDDLIEIYTRVILLSLATTNDYRDKTIAAEEFKQLCSDYVNITDHTLSLVELLQELKNIKNKDEVIPEQFLTNDDPIRIALEFNRCFRTHNLVIRKTDVGICNLYTSWKLFSDYNKAFEDEPANTIKKILRMEPLHFLRSSFSLSIFAKSMNGYVHINTTTYDENFSKSWRVDIDTCLLTAYKLGEDEGKLRENWLDEKIIKSISVSEQKYFPNPLAKYPLIHMNKNQKENQLFMMPSLPHFLYAISNYLFLILPDIDETFNAKFGDFIEKHIEETLRSIFGNCEKIISAKEEKADFKITLPKCTLIIEVKARIAPFDDRSIMGARNIAKLWGELYSTCRQISASCKECINTQKPVIPIVLFYDSFNLQYVPFQIFAQQSGLFKDLGINFLEFFSWGNFEWLLSKTSITKLEQELIKRYNNVDSMKIEDIMNFSLENDTPAHSYEHLKDYENQFRW